MKALALLITSLRERGVTHADAATAALSVSPETLQAIQAAIDGERDQHAKRMLENAVAKLVKRIDKQGNNQCLFAYAARPLERLAGRLHLRFGINRKTGKWTLSVLTLFSGAYLATHPLHGFPHAYHFVWDGFSYTVHGLGAAPLIESFVSFMRRFDK